MIHHNNPPTTSKPNITPGRQGKMHIVSVNTSSPQSPRTQARQESTLNRGINVKQLEKLVYLSNNIIQYEKIGYKEVICSGANSSVVFYEATGNLDTAILEPLFYKIYKIAWFCCRMGQVISAGDMVECNTAFKLLKHKIQEDKETALAQAVQAKLDDALDSMQGMFQ